MKVKGSQSEPRDLEKHLQRKTIQKGCQGEVAALKKMPMGIIFKSHFGLKSIRNSIEKSLKNLTRKNMEKDGKRLPKRS
jgi:hypothetical protein